MSNSSSVLFVSRYYWPELIGSAPFSTDIAEWLAAHGRPTTVVTGRRMQRDQGENPIVTDDAGARRFAASRSSAFASVPRATGRPSHE